MFNLNDGEIFFIALLLEGFFYGLYSGIFIMYLQYQASKGDTNKAQNIMCYFMCALYILSVAALVCDVTVLTCGFFGKELDLLFFRMYFIENTAFACCDFIAQFILIYRCWIVWGRDIRVVIIPALLAFAFLGTWLASTDSQYMLSGQAAFPGWAAPVLLSGLTLSLAVNALVTGLIVFRIFKVFRGVKTTLDDQILGASGGNKLRQIIFILIESGTALFSIQLARLVLTIVGTDTASRALDMMVGIHEMLTGITPTIIVVRTAMGLSFDDEKSMEEFAIESLCFASPNTVLESGSVGVVDQDSRDDSDDSDNIGIERSNNINVGER